jgi:hypothetical protein
MLNSSADVLADHTSAGSRAREIMRYVTMALSVTADIRRFEVAFS